MVLEGMMHLSVSKVGVAGEEFYRGPTVGAKCSCMDFRGCAKCRTYVSFLCVLWKKEHAPFSDA
jgi:hypothetical protein